jgi:hypothetical protein
VPETLPQTVMTILPNETIRLSRRGNRFANDLPGAFSSEVETGSRQENASNQESRAPFRFYRNGKGSSGAWHDVRIYC